MPNARTGTARTAHKTAAMKPSWQASPITAPQEYVNSVSISADGSVVVAGTFFFPYAAGAKHSTADVSAITVGTFAWSGLGKSLWQDEFQATEGFIGLPSRRRAVGNQRRTHSSWPGICIHI